jgi:hypothetical protein
MMKARYPLHSVFATIDADDLSRVWFSAPPRSLNPVLRIYQGEATGPKDPEETYSSRSSVLTGRKLRKNRYPVG